MRASLVAVCVLVSMSAALADGRLISWGGRDLEGMTKDCWEKAKQRSPADVLALNKSASTWPEVYEVLLGANEHRDDQEFLASLAAQVIESKPTVLAKTSRLIIWERISSGQILFEGKGYQVDDDLFVLGGRANWVLRATTKKDFGHVTPTSNREDIEVIRRAWEAYCLRDVYGLDSLPSDPESPAHLCDPDSYTNKYLWRITDVPDVHSHAWWTAWWNKNKDRLSWNSTNARFEVDPPSGPTQP